MIPDLLTIILCLLCGSDGVKLNEIDFQRVRMIVCENPIVRDEARKALASDLSNHERNCIIIRNMLLLYRNEVDIVHLLIAVECLSAKSDHFRHLLNKILATRKETAVIRSCVNAIASMHGIGEDYTNQLRALLENSDIPNDIRELALIVILRFSYSSNFDIAQHCQCITTCKSDLVTVELMSLFASRKIVLSDKVRQYVLALTDSRDPLVRLAAILYKYQYGFSRKDIVNFVMAEISKSQNQLHIALCRQVLASIALDPAYKELALVSIKKLSYREMKLLIQEVSLLCNKKVWALTLSSVMSCGDSDTKQCAVRMLCDSSRK